VEKKENTSGQKLRMENAVQIIEDEIDIFGLHQQIAMARQFGIRAIKTVVQSFALSAAHSIAIMQDGNEVDGSWEEMEDESDDEYASEADASDDEADASEADASDDEEGRVPPLRDACEAAAGSSEEGRVPPLRDDVDAGSSEAANASEAANRRSIFDRLGPRVEEE
jgi:cobalamin biosynthesis protein CobT